ncbi:glyoxysomal fatty acid beta-oxidation multifunctional protein MFP-a isoform X2 [Lactuca sativa]|uniref:glyoxysomal fatty acid beta-oxidation multifunctional protein MFP-a isoform X2 n=1 Tax=Lactuca sativa TaxID=4236 RepID=UPI0022AFCB46|nr:glyoxysomal fatty acid beta-oxidation multifunctional protein MFP-a isoform X2 [Lactuca sativa]
MAMKAKTQLVIGDDGVAIITLNNPPLNLLSFEVMLSLKSSIEEALLCNEVKAIVVNGSGGKFSGGADVKVFGKSEMVKKRNEVGFISIELITNLLEAARKPLVAAIDGPAFGGGLEIALACHARISTPTSQLGLTELQYGIIPGYGGTQRLPRLVGLPKALEMILMSKRVNGKDAFSMSLVDAVAPADELIRSASRWALDISEARKPWIHSLYRTDRLEPLKEARLILNTARDEAQKQNPNVTHPLICIDVIEEGIVSGARIGLWKEAEALNELRQSETCKSLVHIFFARYNTSKLQISGITDMGLQPRKVNRVGVIGPGSIAIATAFILANFPVIFKEDDENSLEATIGEIKANLHSHLMAGKMTKEKLERTVSLLKGVLSYDSFKDVDLVVEAVEGSIQLKQQVFADLEHYCPQHCILASSSPTLDLNLIGERTKSQFRIAGAHFCSSSMLEIVNTECTSPQVIVDLLDVAKKMKKTPILVRNGSGLVVNRIRAMYSQAAMFVAAEQGEEGKHRVEQVMDKFGMAISPFRMMDIVVESMSTLSQNKQDTGSSNSTWKEAKDSPNDFKVAKLSEEDIMKMILFPVVNEACCIMEEGSVVKASDIDVASVVAMGFPSYRGGVVYWADHTLGSKYICSTLETWSNAYGPFFKPCAYLRKYSSIGTPLMQIKSHL